MRTPLPAVLLAVAVALPAQGPTGAIPAPAAKPAAGATAPTKATGDAPTAKKPANSVQFDPVTGWPVGADDGPIPPAKPTGESKPVARGTAAEPTPPAAADAAPTPTLASGTQLGSPLLDIYQATMGPGEFRKLGGLEVQWKVTVLGPNGEEVGVREFVHTADITHSERDRILHQDGRLHGRSGGQVFAERNGMPMPTSTEAAGLELALFGAQLRMPWLFGDANQFAVVGKGVEERGGERLRKILLEQRPPAAADRMGPEAEPKPRDRFELLYDPATGLLREFVHRFATTQQARRVLLEDWRDVDGVRLPCRRVYVDEGLRPTTVLELVQVARKRTSERDFRQP